MPFTEPAEETDLHFLDSNRGASLSHKRRRSAELQGRYETNRSQQKKQRTSPRRGEVVSGNTKTRAVSQSVKSSSEKSYLTQSASSTEVARAMLSRAEDTGETRTVKLARGTPGSPSPVKEMRKNPNRHQNGRSGSSRDSDTGSSLAHPQLGSIGITEVLQEDDRPTFIIDLLNKSNLESDGLEIVYANPAFKRRPGLTEHILGISSDPTQMLGINNNFTSFKSWALRETTGHVEAEGQPGTYVFAGFDWAYSVVRKHLRIFRGRFVPNLQSEQAVSHRPGFQLYRSLPSSDVTPQIVSNSTPQQDLLSPGYFGLNASATRATIPDALHALVHTEDSSSEDESQELGGSQAQASPPANGDMGIGELIENALSPSPGQRTLPAPNNSEGLDSLYASHDSATNFFDWTRLPISPSLKSHVHFARSIDWAMTSLGPIEEWSADLRSMCNLIMASPHPAAMYWGSEHVAIYNEPYVLLAGNKHPELMGMRYRDAWAEIWDAISDVFASAMTSAQATMKDDDCLFLYRNGYLEETYFSWSIIPLIGADGSVVGLYNPAFEKTRRKIAERRMLTLREIGEKTANARKVSEFWGLLLEGLEYNELDAPLVIVYSLQDENPESETASGMGPDTISTTSSQAWRRVCNFEDALGVLPGHPAAPLSIDLKNGKEGFAPYFRQAMTTNKPVILREEDGTLDIKMLENVNWRGFGDPSRVIVVSPIHPTTGDSTLGFLIMGTNPRRPYDEDYNLFVQLLGRQLATSVASVVLFEEEIRRGERAAKMAAQDRIELSFQLAQRTQEAIESENKFTRMAELAPVGMFMADNTGMITFVNDTWYDIANYPRGQPVSNNWINYVLEDDQEKCRKIWNTVVNELTPVRVEFRFKHPWRDEFGNTGETWVLASSFPEKTEDGKLKGIFGSVTDISTQKFAEGLQKKRMEEAMEMKRQQENFVDITSHEMRNPLSAILQCSDEISTTLMELKNTGGLDNEQAEIIESNIDAAQTITLCAQHQKRIVDDVLTLSKLDSAMLLVTPTDSQPVTVAQRALRMFEGELQNAGITLDLEVHDSFHQLKVDWVKLDPSRLLQVMINLITNAIKFTMTQETKKIVFHVGASLEPGTYDQKYKVTYVPVRNQKGDATTGWDWGHGGPVYIHFAVQDTGRGLTESEIKTLFQRFSQASPRTHVTYGGSGLGLFISRELVELQGGQIGVASESGKGSTFAFYVKSRRSNAPADNTENANISLMQQRKGSAKGGRPLSQKSANPSTAVSGATKNAPSAKARATSPDQSKDSMEALHVLVVEDNLVNQKVLAKQLRKAGCIVYVANHGGEAIEQIQRSTFWHSNMPPPPPVSTPVGSVPVPAPEIIEISVVLLDLEMPVMDGQTCARKLRQYQLDGQIVRHVPVIAVTANARDEQIRNTLDAGIDDVVSKPFRVQELMPKVKALVQKWDPDGKIRGEQYRKGEDTNSDAEMETKNVDMEHPYIGMQ